MFQPLPPLFLERLKKIYSDDELQVIEPGYATPKRNPLFRIHTTKHEDIESTLVELKEKELNIKPLSFLVQAYMLEGGTEKDLWDLQCYKNGWIYLQGITSQIPINLLKKYLETENLSKDNLNIIDLAAAPGGKTSQLATLGTGNHIVASELSTIRAEKLRYNLKKLWVEDIEIVTGDARQSLAHMPDTSADVLLFDAPCSGEGIINYAREKSYNGWDIRHIKKNYLLQRDILRNNLRLLKPGGILLYSTCTLAPEENEGILHFLLCNYPELQMIDVMSFWTWFRIIENIHYKPWITQFWDTVYKKEVSKGVRILPSSQNEGFFIGMMRKEG